jgi:dihydrofolate synthase/folylpolyglutamate synthase
VYQRSEPFGQFRIPLLGQYQTVNATTAIAAVSLLEAQGVSPSTEEIEKGLESVSWPGRMEILGRRPLTVVDSAHNADSARKLREALQELFDFHQLIMVIGASADHITPEILRTFLTGSHRTLVTATRHPKAASPVWIQTQAAELGFETEVCPTVTEALDLALGDAGPHDLICCTGSVFVAAEARAAWFMRQGMEPPPSDPN